LLVALAETLTVNRLGIAGRLLGDRGARQPLESIELVRDHAARVQRWSSGMALRWRRPGCTPPRPSSAPAGSTSL
jgi:hypothetical protein